MVDVMQPRVDDWLIDPACGTGGFLLVAHEYVAEGAASMTPTQREHLRDDFATGYELVDGTARLAAMNMLLHGIGTSNGETPIIVQDSLLADPGSRWTLVLTNPPFGRKSSLTMVGADGREVREDTEIERQDFVATTSNKQLNFVQHIMTILDINGRAAVVLPDNVLFEGGAGEIIRRKLLNDFDLHTMLRLPTGIFYAQGVKANVLFFDKKPANPGRPWTERLWVYDLRTNQHFTLKQNPLRREHLDDFAACFKPGHRDERVESERWHSFAHDQLMARDKANLDITWLRDESLEDLDNLPSPDIIAREIVEDLSAALAEFEAVASALEAQLASPDGGLGEAV
jgi:type I restriction enzyme M protein